MGLTQISTAGVKNDAITSDKIPDDGVQNEHYLNNSVGTDAIANGSVTTAELADGNVTTAKIADDAVTAAKIANNTITATQLNTDAVDTDALQVNSVTTAKIANDAVTADKLADSAVGTSNIVDGTVTLAKLPHGTSSNDGKFLRANNGADPTFETVTSTTINSNANNKLITGSDTANTLEAEGNLTWDNSAGLLSVKHGYSSGGGTGLLLYDTTSTGANEGMNIEWRSGTDKTSDQCRLGQYSNGTGDGSSLDFYTNHQDTGSSTRRLRIDSKGNLVTGNVGSPTSSDTGNFYVKPASTIGSAGIGLNIAANAVFNGAWKAIATGATGILSIGSSGNLQYRTDNSTNAGSNFSLERRFAISENGRTLLANDTTVTANGNLAGAISRVQITGPASVTAYTLANSYLHIGGTESTVNHLHAMSFGHIKTAGTYSPAYIGLKTVDQASYENGQIEIATRNVTTDTVPTPSLIVRPSKHIVHRGPSYGIWTEDVKTVNGGSSAIPTQYLEDCYGLWIVVAKISSTNEFKGTMNSTSTLDTTTNQLTGNPHWSSNWGDTYPSEVRYISASDWDYWRETRIVDFIHGVPDGRQWKRFFLNGRSSGFDTVAGKQGWTCAGCYDGFGRWRNPEFTSHRMADGSTNDITTADTFWTTSGQTTNWYGQDDAKFIASHNDNTDGQDDEYTTGWGWDDGQLIRSDEFPSKGSNGSGTDLADKNLWICIKLSSPTFGHNS